MKLFRLCGPRTLLFVSSFIISTAISGSHGAYSNGKSRFQEFRGCNQTESLTVNAQDDYPSVPPESATPTASSSSTSKATVVTSETTTTSFPQNNYFQPVILGPLGNRMSVIGFGSNSRITHPYNSLSIGGTGNEVKEDRIPIYSPSTTRLAQLRQSIMAYRNQITGNRFFEGDGSVRFFLYTRNNPSTAHHLWMNDKNSIDTSEFDGNKTTKLIIHGFSDIGILGEWVTNLRDAYLSTSDSNVIVADFSSFETFLLFWTNLPIFASKRIADLVTFLELTTGTSRENFHLIARSWGTHVAGVTGRLLQGRLGRITGLEPEPRVYGTVLPDYRLVHSDAQFVDVIRVNGRRYFFHGSRFGLAPPAGHVDIYPNYLEKSNGCPGTATNYGRFNFAYCHRGRGVSYFTESIKYPQSHPMCQCKSYSEYKSGYCECNRENSKFYLGEYLSNQTRGVFQLANPTFGNNVFRTLRLFG